jgi:hypothetical protein
MTELIELIWKCLRDSEEVKDYLENASIFITKYENGRVCDAMVLLEDDDFINRFSPINGSNFVIDKHFKDQDIFIRIKHYSWIEKDFSKRVSIALWILKNSIIIQEKQEKISSLINEYQNRFEKSLVSTISQKYLELRTERHNLRFSLKRNDILASLIIKSTIAKISLELCFLSEKNPYPFKILLSQTESEYGKRIATICKDFLTTNNFEESIALSDELINKLIDMLSKKTSISSDFLEKWWKYLP